MADNFTFNDREFVEALRQYEEATGKGAAEIVNKKGKDACFKAAKHTEKMKAPKLTPFNPSVKKWKDADKGGNRYSNRLHYASAAKKGATKGAGIKQKAEKEQAKRKSAAGYSKAIWFRIARDFGAALRGKFNIKNAKGKKATPTNPVAILEATKLEVSHINDIMVDSLKKALKEVERDTREYSERKLAETAEKYSAK